MAKQGITLKYDRIHTVLGEGNLWSSSVRATSVGDTRPSTISFACRTAKSRSIGTPLHRFRPGLSGGTATANSGFERQTAAMMTGERWRWES